MLTLCVPSKRGTAGGQEGVLKGKKEKRIRQEMVIIREVDRGWCLTGAAEKKLEVTDNMWTPRKTKYKTLKEGGRSQCLAFASTWKAIQSQLQMSHSALYWPQLTVGRLPRVDGPRRERRRSTSDAIHFNISVTRCKVCTEFMLHSGQESFPLHNCKRLKLTLLPAVKKQVMHVTVPSFRVPRQVKRMNVLFSEG